MKTTTFNIMTYRALTAGIVVDIFAYFAEMCNNTIQYNTMYYL